MRYSFERYKLEQIKIPYKKGDIVYVVVSKFMSFNAYEAEYISHSIKTNNSNYNVYLEVYVYINGAVEKISYFDIVSKEEYEKAINSYHSEKKYEYNIVI